MPLYKKITLSVTLLLISAVSNLSAQIVENHIGFRGGLTSGIYYQNIISSGNAERAFHVSLSSSRNTMRLTVLKLTYEMNLTEFTDNLFLVWGYGGHIGFSVTDEAWFLGRRYQFAHERFRPLVGIDAFGGVEYRIIGFPLIVGLNIKPYAEIMVPGFVKIQPGDIGLSIAYRF